MPDLPQVLPTSEVNCTSGAFADSGYSKYLQALWLGGRKAGVWQLGCVGKVGKYRFLRFTRLANNLKLGGAIDWESRKSASWVVG